MKYLAKICALAMAWMTLSSQAANDLSNKEIWFGPNGTPPGHGTLSDPYDVGQFRWIITGMVTGNAGYTVATNTTVHLLPGTYTFDHPSNSQFDTIPDGIRILGSNMTNTFITQSNYTNTSEARAVLTSPVNLSSFYISDVTIDCAWSSTNFSIEKAQAIAANAKDVTIERVRAINFGSSGTTNEVTRECFVIWAGTPTNGGGNITIQDCVVEGAFQGGTNGYASCICVWQFSDAASRTNSNAIVRNNTIRGVGPGNGILYAGENILIEGNHVTGTAQGVNSDTGGGKNLMIINNSFDNVGIGVDVGASLNGSEPSYDGVLIADNYIELNDLAATNAVGSVFLAAGVRLGGFVQNATVVNNTIEQMPAFRGSTNGNWYWVQVASYYTWQPNTNIALVNNSVGPGMLRSITSAWDYSVIAPTHISYEAGNHYLDGTGISLFPSSSYSFGDTNTDYTIDTLPANHLLAPTMWFGLAGSYAGTVAGAKTIHLPDPTYYNGRTFVLMGYKGGTANSASVALQADSNSAGSPYTSKTIIDVKTGTQVAAGSPFTAVAATTGVVNFNAKITSVNNSWVLER